MNSIKWIFEYLKPYKYRYSFGLILVLIVSGMAMLNPMLTGKIVDEVLGEGQTHLLIPILLSMLLILTVKNMITYYYQITFEKVSQNVMFEGRKQCYEKLMSLDFDFYHQTRTGDLMARLTGDTDCIRHFISWVIYTIFS